MDDKSGPIQTSKVKKMELLQSGVAALYQDKLLCDVQLQAEGKIFPAHKTVLAAVTDYFRAMFTGGYKESKAMDEPIVMEGLSANGLEVILDAIYTTELKVTSENILETLPVACMLQIQPLIDECEECLISSISAQKFFVYAKTADKFSLQRAVKYFADYRKACFPEISATLDFKELDAAEVVTYLSLPDLFLNGQEMTAFDAAIRWLEHKPKERKKFVLDVFRCINLVQIPLSDITEKVSKVKLIADNSECMVLIVEALKYHREVFTQPFYDGKIVNTRGVTDGMVAFPSWVMDDRPRNYEEIFGDLNPDVAFWKYLSFENQGSYKCFGSHTSHHRKPADFAISQMPEICDFEHPIKIGNFLFLFAPYSPAHSLRYNPALDEWVRLKPVPLDDGEKCMCYVQCSKKHIMVVGGKRPEPLSIEPGSSFYFIYSIADDEWKKGEAQLELCLRPLACYHNGTVYVVDGTKLLSYDMDRDIWIDECSWQISPHRFFQGHSRLLGHNKSLFVLSAPSYDIPLEYRLDTKCVSQCSKYPLKGIILIGAFSNKKYLYYILRDDEQVQLIQCTHPDSKDYTVLRTLPCYCHSICAVPMVLPRY